MADLVFVCGVPRSGTTLLSNIIDTHNSSYCLIEPYLDWRCNGSFMHEEIGENIDKNPLDFLSDLDSDKSILGFKETYKNPWLNKGMQNSSETKKFIKEVDESIFIVRDIRAVWVSTTDVWNSNRESIEIYASCWNNLLGLIDSENLNYIKYEDLVTRPKKFCNEIFDLLNLEFDYSKFNLNKRNVKNQPGCHKAKKSKKIFKSSVDKWKNKIKKENKNFLETRCNDGLRELNYF